MSGQTVAHALLVAILAMASAGCGRDDTRSAADPGPIHVHGLGINPADGALLIATHTGLWRVGAQGRLPARVGDTKQDTMGFTVAGPDHFLASGHPSLGEIDEGTPLHLGLIESRDGGRTWEELSLHGEADLHTLRIVDDGLLALNARDGRLLRSSDGGVSWNGIETPLAFFDIVTSPDGKRWVASAQDGLYGSDDQGASWARLGALTGLLAWPDPRSLYLVAPDGGLYVSGDAGARFSRRGLAATPAAFAATAAEALYVAAHHDGTVYESTDGGRTWRVRSRPKGGGQ